MKQLFLGIEIDVFPLPDSDEWEAKFLVGDDVVCFRTKTVRGSDPVALLYLAIPFWLASSRAFEASFKRPGSMGTRSEESPLPGLD